MDFLFLMQIYAKAFQREGTALAMLAKLLLLVCLLSLNQDLQ